MAKATMATVKSFLKKNKGKIFINRTSKFDGMFDLVMPCVGENFTLAVEDGYSIEDALYRRTLGISGAWFVGGSRDSIMPFERNGFRGFQIFNSCGSFDLAVKIIGNSNE